MPALASRTDQKTDIHAYAQNPRKICYGQIFLGFFDPSLFFSVFVKVHDYESVRFTSALCTSVVVVVVVVVVGFVVVCCCLLLVVELLLILYK